MPISSVRAEQVPPVVTAVVRRRASPRELAAAIPAACGEVWAYARAHGLARPGRHVALYLDDKINYECGVEVAAPFAGDGPVFCSSTPSGRIATATLLGGYAGLGETHDAVRRWCAARGERLAGPNWEIYGHWTDDEAQLRTDVFYLLAPAPGAGPAT